jgi:hypothetical protein
MAVCLDGMRIVGAYAAIPRLVRAGGRACVGARDVDPVVHPDYRGRGLFKRMLGFALENFTGIDFFFNFANQVSRPGFLRLGWREVGRLKDAVCQLGQTRLTGRQLMLHLLTYRRAPGRPGARVGVCDLGELLARAPEPTVPPAAVWVERSAAYLDWRYLRHPLHRYRCYLEPDAGGRPLRLLVTRYEEKRRALILLDIVGFGGADHDLRAFLPVLARDHPGAWTCLFRTAPREARRCFLSNPWRRGAGLPFLVRSFPSRTPPSGIFDLDRFWVMHGDMEIF